MKRIIEVCCTSVEDVIEAAAGGASRVELCSAISCGGVTPGHSLIQQAVAIARESRIPENSGTSGRLMIHVLIRPREGSFHFSISEVNTLLNDIRFCHEAGVDGVAIGALTVDGHIDMESCRKMMEAAHGMSITFHRAFDVCRNPEQALEQIIELGCDRLLSSGQQPSALEGAPLLAKLVKQAAGRIIIMPGSGITPSVITKIELITGANEFHSTARAAVPDPCTFHVPSIGFDEAHFSYSPDGRQRRIDPSGRLILRTSRTIVRQLVWGNTGFPE